MSCYQGNLPCALPGKTLKPPQHCTICAFWWLLKMWLLGHDVSLDGSLCAEAESPAAGRTGRPMGVFIHPHCMVGQLDGA